MNDQQLEDLKQFIDGRISQTEAMFEDQLEQTESRLGDGVEKLEVGLEALRKEMLDGFTGVGNAIEEINKQVDERLTKLGQKTA